ncbi:hypothetical protein AB0I30_03675 [Nocardia tengchongensis]|uniref:hypothetical protein n=1 Tax=Nocardia tengchongensis TaxID=2055889 RepID=UPI0033DF335B
MTEPDPQPDAALRQQLGALKKLEQAALLAHLGRREAARDLAAAVVAAEPENSVALTTLAYMSLTCGDETRAFECATAALALDSAHGLAWIVRSSAALRLGFAASEDSAERRDRFQQALSAARRAQEVEPRNPESHMAFAKAICGTDPHAALAALHRVLELDPENVEVHRLRAGIFLEALPNRELAVEELHELLRLAPEDAQAMHLLGRIAAAAGDLDTAADRMRQAARSDPLKADLIRGDLERVLAEQRERAAAAAVPQSSGPAQPQGVPSPEGAGDPEVLADLRRCDAERWRSIERADVERAVARLAELRQANPDDIGILYESALADWLCGRWRTAITRLRRVARLDPERAAQVEAQIAAIEAAERQIIETRAAQREKKARRERQQAESDLELAAEQSIARRAARARVRGSGSAKVNAAELDAAVRVRRPGPFTRPQYWLVVFPLLILLRLMLHSCAADSSHSGSDRPVTTPPAPLYNPYTPFPPLTGILPR